MCVAIRDSAAGKTMIELQSNMAVRGTTQMTDGVLPTQGALHASLEITHGFTSWFEIGLYTFSALNPGWIGNGSETVSVLEFGSLKVGIGL